VCWGIVVYGLRWRFLILLLWVLVGFVLSFCLALVFFPLLSLSFDVMMGMVPAAASC
jgi:hypothetical protein